MTAGALIVTLLVFSGRQNPSWTAPAAFAERIEAALAALAPIESGCEPLSGLGYTGVEIQLPRPSGPPRDWTVGGGFALTDGRCFLDPDRHVEKLALASGRGAFDSGLAPRELLE